jgi:biopolymer transport protein ExbB/TolQ
MSWRIELAQHAAERAATVVHARMARGLFGLATVAATAPFLGIIGTLLGIFDSFRGITGDKTSIMAAIAGSLSDALAPTALGVLVAVTALGAFHYLAAALAEIDAEMHTTTIGLTLALRRFDGLTPSPSPSSPS